MARADNTIEYFQERDGNVCWSVGCKVERLRLIYKLEYYCENHCCSCLLQDSNDNTHLNPEEITENNIDEEIKNVGRRCGMAIEKKCETGRFWSNSQLGHNKGVTGA